MDNDGSYRMVIQGKDDPRMGISFSYGREPDCTRHGWPENEVRFAYMGTDTKDTSVFRYQWKSWDLSLEERRELADNIAEVVGFRPREIDGFTLFFNDTKMEGKKPHWQMSVRRWKEAGWSISHITQQQAQTIFKLLENSGHPDGPWKIAEEFVQADVVAPVAAISLIVAIDRNRRARERMNEVLATLVAPNAE
jgi:hypothetical protein